MEIHETPVEDVRASLEVIEEEPVETPIEEEIQEQPHEEPEEPKEPDYKTVAGEQERRLEEQQRRIEQQEKLLAKVGTEIGLLRKSSPEEETARLQKIRDMYFDDPIAADQELDRFKNEKREQAYREQQEQQTVMATRTRDAIKRYVPTFEETVPEIVNLLKEDGFPDEAVTAFQKSPYHTPTDMLFVMAKRVEAVKERNELKQKVAALEGKIATLEKKPDDLLRRIEQASRTTLTGKTGGAAPKDQLSPSQALNRLSVDELRKIANGG